MIANPRVFPLSAVEFVIGRAFVARADAEQRAEGVERVEAPVKAEHAYPLPTHKRWDLLDVEATMADVTGPIRTLSGAVHAVPDGQKCDNHPRRKAVARVQGETDSFGCEMHDLCKECLAADRAWEKTAEAAEWRKGKCEWCKSDVTDLRDARDYDEGLYGRVYRVCGVCQKRQEDEARAELDRYDDGYFDDGDLS